MSDFNPRDYKGYRLEKTGRDLSLYYVKVFDLSKVKDPKCNDLSNNPHEKAQYTTSTEYKNVMEAFAEAYGWIDCTSNDQTDPDCYEKAYNELDVNELYRYPYLNQKEARPGDKERMEPAYKNGWGKKLIQKNVHN